MNKLLIVASANTYNHLNRIEKITSSERALTYYNASNPLYQSIKRAFDLGCKEIYACNVQTSEDYFDIYQQLKYDAFSSVVFPGLTFDQKVTLTNGKTLPLALALLEKIRPKKTRLFFSDYHSRYFYTIQECINHYNHIAQQIYHFTSPELLPHVVLTMNHLELSEWAAIDTAVSLLLTQVGSYPNLEYGASQYNFDLSDFHFPVVYFRSNTLIKPSIENLFNLGTTLEANLLIQDVVFIIKEECRVDCFRGKRFNTIVLKEIVLYVENYLDTKVGHYFQKYRIKETPILRDRRGVEIEIIIEILPYFSYDTIEVSLVVLGV